VLVSIGLNITVPAVGIRAIYAARYRAAVSDFAYERDPDGAGGADIYDDDNDDGPDPPDHLSDWFWDVIAQAGGDVPRMRAILNELDVPDLRRFHEELEDAVCELLDEPFTEFLTDASEDGATDVAYWAVSQGRAYYHELFAHPERIPRDVERHPLGVLHAGITLAVYFDRTGEYPPYRP
jgi:hypothetical protein